ncbi:xanthine dehydrogenase family protein subunit M [Pelagibius sp. 7325]|uniref:FAD binding domain-containing protein n=1 Tax=Pelagibius sp. 7325 TaxID=3131994 RepID=UPI0030EC5EAE
MRSFHYERAQDIDAAVQSAADANASYLAGGTTLLDLMKLDVLRPSTVVDIGSLEDHFGSIEVNRSGLKLGALVRMADAAEHPEIRRDYPMIAQSLEKAASTQLRHMATLGGNVLQRTRCAYFRDPDTSACNKRVPGSGCAALEGLNRTHAVLGTSSQCIATYPGDFAQALIALDASVMVAGPEGPRSLSFEDLHVPPGETPHIETVLQPGELITSFSIEAAPWTRRSIFLKVRDRESFAFALASAAIALDMDSAGGKVQAARIALGGVATRPWRSHEAEALLVGKPFSREQAEMAAEAAFSGADPRPDNAYKIELGRRCLTAALCRAAAMELS